MEAWTPCGKARKLPDGSGGALSAIINQLF